MVIEDFGGNKVGKFSIDREGKLVLGENPYEYFAYTTKSSETIEFSHLLSFTVFFYKLDGGPQFTLNGTTLSAAEGDLLQCEDCEFALSVEGGACVLLVAGTAKDYSGSEKGITHVKYDDIYRVDKPWGYELWLTGEHPSYALKKIFIKSGNQTSLQYHVKKRETNALFEGSVRLHYKNDHEIGNDNVTLNDVSTVELSNFATIDVFPPVLHRLEAVSDVTLYEVSTPDLDDVVRVQDDSNRVSGRIPAEHSQ